MSTWAVEDRPVEKVLSKGLQMLSDAELISVMISSGTMKENPLDIARNVMFHCNNDLNELAKKSIDELMLINGIGKNTAAKILIGFELARRRPAKNVGHSISMSSQIQTEFLFLKDFLHEEFWMLLMNRTNRMIEKVPISVGGSAGTVVDTKLMMKKALLKNASGIIAVHNHPSGNTNPGVADDTITRKIKQACEFLDINLLDHVIIAGDSYLSYADEGRL